LIQKEDKAR